MGLANRVALVTGAGQGIGTAILRRLHAEGAVVVGLDKFVERIDPLCATLGPRARCHLADLTDRAALQNAVRAVYEAHGRIDILVNNAGIFLYRPFDETPLEQWRHVFDVNLEGHAYLTQLVVQHMRKAGYG